MSTPDGDALGSRRRLEALAATGLVGSPAEEGFDRFARLAVSVLRAPIALISFLDDKRHFLKSAIGLPEPWLGRRELPLSHLPCEHVINPGEPLVLRDARGAFGGAPAFADLGIAAYLGVPLRTPSGQVIGSLCVADTVPRDWSDSDLQTLSDLAQGVTSEIAARLYRLQAEQAQHALEDKEAKTAEILESMDEAFYSVDRDWRLTYANRGAERFWKRKRRRLLGSSMFDLFPRFRGSEPHRAHERAMKAGKPVRIETVSTATGTPVELNIFPSPSGLSVYFRDISDRHQIEAELRKRGDILKLAEESAGIGIWDMEPETGLVRGTPQFFRIMGMEPTEDAVPIETMRSIRHPADRERVIYGYNDAVATGADTYETEYRIRRNDGQTRWIFGRGRVNRDGSGKPVRYSGIDIDITDRKRTEDALRRNEERLRLALQAARMFAWEYDIESGEVERSGNANEILGPPGPGGTFLELMYPEDRTAFETAIKRTIAEGEPCDFEYRFRNPGGGGWLWLNVTAVRVDETADSPRRLVGVAIDITERVRQLEALRESEARFRTTADSAPAFIWMSDGTGSFTFLNKPFAAYLGLADRTTDIDLEHFVHPEDVARVGQARATALEAVQSFSFEARLRRADQTWRWFRSEAVPRIERGVLLGFTGCSVDITEAKQAEALLQSANLTLREQVKIETAEKERAVRDRERFWDLSQDLFAVFSNVDGKPRLINAPAWEKALGYPAAKLTQTRFLNLIHPDDVGKTLAAADALRAGEAIFGLENRYRHADGSWRWLSWNVINEADLSYSVARDVTLERAREEALRRSQKLEALGQLTGGVAHDFNNLLTVVIGALDLVQKHPLDGRLSRLIGAALSAARKGERLNQQLLGFGRRQPMHEEFVKPGRTIEDMRPLILGALAGSATLHLEVTAQEQGCRLDPAQFEATILNLVVNARDAMPGGGDLTIRVREASSEEVERNSLPDQPYLAISVEDNGAGMSPDVLSRVFEPFFTTKEVGRGSGLGLAQVYGFAQQSRGTVDIRSNEGSGTVVAVYLPVSELKPDESSPRSARLHPERRCRILLVEDDVLVGAVAESMLTDRGHIVTRTERAEEALDVLARGDFDLLVTDIRMPGKMNGVDLAREATRQRKGLRVLLCSGWTADALGDELTGVSWPFLRKPFAAEDLARAVGEALQ